MKKVKVNKKKCKGCLVYESDYAGGFKAGEHPACQECKRRVKK